MQRWVDASFIDDKGIKRDMKDCTHQIQAWLSAFQVRFDSKTTRPLISDIFIL